LVRLFYFYKMKLFLHLFLFLCTSSIYAQDSELKSIELKRFQAMVSADTMYLHKVISVKLFYTHSNGLTQDKTDFISSISTKRIEYQKIDSVEHKLMIVGSTAIFNGTIYVEGLLNDKQFKVKLRYTDVYILENKKWKLITWQSTKIQ
jgi:hypothetical protein